MNKTLQHVAVLALLGVGRVAADGAVFVDSNQLLRESKAGRNIVATYEKSQEEARQTEYKKTEELTTLRNKIGEGLQSGKYDESTLQVESEKFAKLQKEMKRTLEDLQDKMESEKQKNIMAFQNDIKAVVAEYCQKNNVTSAQDAARTPGLLYVDSKCDVTKDILKDLNARYSKFEAKSAITTPTPLKSTKLAA